VVTMVSPFDSKLRTRAIRRIDLGFGEPVMRIRTTFEAGATNRLSIWVITQLKDPLRIYVPVRPNSIFPSGYVLQSAIPPKGLRQEDGFISLFRDPRQAHKIGLDSTAMLWVGTNVTLTIISSAGPADSTRTFPDGGSRVEVYTNPDPAYVELESLGPIEQLRPGELITRTNVYRLSRRTKADPLEEARLLIGQIR